MQRNPQAPLISDRARWAAGRRAAERGRVDGSAHGSLRLADLITPGPAHRLHRGAPPTPPRSVRPAQFPVTRGLENTSCGMVPEVGGQMGNRRVAIRRGAPPR